MIRIAITPVAFEAVARHAAARLGRLRAGGRRKGRAPDLGLRLLWWVGSALHGPGESYSDVILRLARLASAG